MSSQNLTVAIIGLGYVGLPLALLFLDKGYKVIGIDMDQQKIEKLGRGISYLPDLSDSVIRSAKTVQNFRCTTDYNYITYAHVIVLCVPTPLDEQHRPDLSFLIQAAQQIKHRLQYGQLIILESSTYPGTTKDVLLPILEESGLKVGRDLYLGYSPERVDPGNKDYPLHKITKIISGVTEECSRKVHSIYSQVFNEVHTVSTTEAAELTKLLENSYRFINISFINELAIICDEMKINVWEIIDAAKTKPFGFTAFYPGPGVGGHCIPVDPLYLQWIMKQRGIDTHFINLSQKTNDQMPSYIVNQIQSLLSDNRSIRPSSILLYGVAYKRNTNDVRDSSALEIIRLLKALGNQVEYHDPFIPSIQIGDERMESIELSDEILRRADCVVILTDHSGIPICRMMEHASLIYDTRNVINKTAGKATVIRLGGGGKITKHRE